DVARVANDGGGRLAQLVADGINVAFGWIAAVFVPAALESIDPRIRLGDELAAVQANGRATDRVAAAIAHCPNRTGLNRQGGGGGNSGCAGKISDMQRAGAGLVDAG